MNILITGTSSGLGYELAKQFISKGDTVYGISRGISDLNIKQIQCDFHDLQAISIALNKLIDVTTFDLVILNAGILGVISKTNKITSTRSRITRRKITLTRTKKTFI